MLLLLPVGLCFLLLMLLLCGWIIARRWFKSRQLLLDGSHEHLCFAKSVLHTRAARFAILVDSFCKKTPGLDSALPFAYLPEKQKSGQIRARHSQTLTVNN